MLVTGLGGHCVHGARVELSLLQAFKYFAGAVQSTRGRICRPRTTAAEVICAGYVR